jgi:hypothetical protein
VNWAAIGFLVPGCCPSWRMAYLVLQVFRGIGIQTLGRSDSPGWSKLIRSVRESMNPPQKEQGRANRGPAHLQSVLVPEFRVRGWPVPLGLACDACEVPQHNPQKEKICGDHSRLHAQVVQHETPPSVIQLWSNSKGGIGPCEAFVRACARGF